MVASLGEDSGYVPYTAFSAKKSFIETHPDVIQSFTNALQKGMDYVNSHSPEDIAKVISPQFEEDAFTLIQNILEEAGELPARVPYDDLVTTDFAKEAVK